MDGLAQTPQLSCTTPRKYPGRKVGAARSSSAASPSPWGARRGRASSRAGPARGTRGSARPGSGPLNWGVRVCPKRRFLPFSMSFPVLIRWWSKQGRRAAASRRRAAAGAETLPGRGPRARPPRPAASRRSGPGPARRPAWEPAKVSGLGGHGGHEREHGFGRRWAARQPARGTRRRARGDTGDRGRRQATGHGLEHRERGGSQGGPGPQVVATARRGPRAAQPPPPSSAHSPALFHCSLFLGSAAR